MRILIVEDDPLFAEILNSSLRDKGCVPVLATTLAEGKELLSEGVFDFVLLDNRLPDGAGIRFLPHIKQLPYRIPTMMITAEDNHKAIVDAFDKGADDFLIKPISTDLLWKKIERCRSYYDKEASLAQQTQRLERMLDRQEQEEQLARYVYEHVAATALAETAGIDTYLQSSSAFNGDFFISEVAPNGNRFVILADATGHGLAAAISILPLITTLKAMIRKGLSLAHMVHEANKKLNKELPDDKFVTLIGVEINYHFQRLDLFNGGMPPVCVVLEDQSVETYPSGSMALGILEPADFDPNIISLDADFISNIFFFSDGLIEQPNPEGELFGMSGVLDILKNHRGKEPLVSRIVNEFTVFNEMQELLDDLSMCDIQLPTLLDSHEQLTATTPPKSLGSITANIEINGPMLAKADIVGCLDGIMRSVDMVGNLRQRAFTVFAELISNGLDHGILDLDSKLKNDIAGFADYLYLKEERMENIGEDQKLGMKLVYSESNNEIDFEIVDSGKGFDVQEVADMQDQALSGRGLELINKLCKRVDVIAPGNKTLVNLKRDH